MQRQLASLMIGRMIAPSAPMMLLSRLKSRKLRFQMIADTPNRCGQSNRCRSLYTAAIGHLCSTAVQIRR
jgi:hypothetical protein